MSSETKLLALTEASYGILDNAHNVVVATFPLREGEVDKDKLTWLDEDAPMMSTTDFLNSWMMDPDFPRLDQWIENTLGLPVHGYEPSPKYGWFTVDRISVTSRFVEFRVRGDIALVEPLFNSWHGFYVGGMYTRHGEDVEAAITVRPSDRWTFHAGICDPQAPGPWAVIRVAVEDVYLQTVHPGRAKKPRRPNHLKEIK